MPQDIPRPSIDFVPFKAAFAPDDQSPLWDVSLTDEKSPVDLLALRLNLAREEALKDPSNRTIMWFEYGSALFFVGVSGGTDWMLQEFAAGARLVGPQPQAKTVQDSFSELKDMAELQDLNGVDTDHVSEVGFPGPLSETHPDGSPCSPLCARLKVVEYLFEAGAISAPLATFDYEGTTFYVSADSKPDLLEFEFLHQVFTQGKPAPTIGPVPTLETLDEHVGRINRSMQMEREKFRLAARRQAFLLEPRYPDPMTREMLDNLYYLLPVG